MTIECQKSLFTLPDGLHYLNGAYMSPTPKAVQEVGVDAVRRKGDPSGILPDDFFRDGERVRRLFAQLVHASDPARIAIVPSASYGLAAAARNTTVARGQRIVVLHEQFPSNVYTWHRLCRDAGADLHTVTPPKTDGNRANAWTDRVLEAVDRSTAIVALPQLHWADGARLDLETIGDRARQVGAALIVDGTQSVGALPFDIERIRPDALVCAGYKWLMGPYSIGVAYFGERYDAGVPLEENWISRLGSEDFRGLVNYQERYQPGAMRYDVGERSNFILVPMLARALELVLDWTPEAIQAYCEALTRPLFDELPGLGYRVGDAAEHAAHLLGIRLPEGLDVAELQRQLQDHQVSVSARGSAIRVSPHLYNDASDIAALLEVLRDAAERGTRS